MYKRGENTSHHSIIHQFYHQTTTKQILRGGGDRNYIQTVTHGWWNQLKQTGLQLAIITNTVYYTTNYTLFNRIFTTQSLKIHKGKENKLKVYNITK